MKATLLAAALVTLPVQDGPKDMGDVVVLTRPEAEKIAEQLTQMQAFINEQQKKIDKLKYGTGCT